MADNPEMDALAEAINRHLTDAFARWGIPLPEEALGRREDGHLFEDGWHVGWGFGEESDGDEFVEVLTEHRHPGMHRFRLHGSGRIEHLDVPTSLMLVPEDDAERKRVERELLERNRRLYAELRERRLLPPEGENLPSQDIAEHLSTQRVAPGGNAEVIDTAFDVRSDTPGWPMRDPDTHSPTLRRYHQLLWSKPLPSGAPFELDVTRPRTYLYHRSELGEFGLSSDAVVPSFSRAPDMKHIVDQIPEAETEAFNRIGYTIGGMMVWPGYKVDGKMTINGARGFHPRIRDRFDLTLECIRRHYRDEHSPLSDTLARYADFFALFGDFAGYVDFFHLQDLVDKGGSMVRFSMPFEGFTGSPLPATLDAYLAYRKRAIEFIEARNRRIAAHVSAGR